MKLKGVLFASVALNVALFAYRGSQPSAAPSDSKASVATNIVTKTIASTKVVTNEVALPPEFVRLDWQTVESDDFKKYIANLRAIKCPEETIRDIIIADINKVYAAKWRALRQPTPDIKYWEPWDSMAEYYDQNLRKQKKELEVERKALVMELLGVDLDQESRKYQLAFTGNEREEMLMGFLEEGKRNTIMGLKAKSREQTMAIQEKAKNGRLSAEDQAEIIKIRKNEVAEMKKVLTPQEFEQYVMRVSATANVVRSQLVGFGPTEQEFVGIFRAQTWYNDQFNSKVQTGDPAEMQQRVAAQQQMEQMVKQAIGDDRFNEYQRSKDYEYRELVRFTQQNELPMQTAAAVYDMRKIALAESAKIRSNGNLSPEQQQRALGAIAEQTRAALQKTMSESAFKEYEGSRGSWLQTIGR